MIKFYNTDLFDVPESEKDNIRKNLRKQYDGIEALSDPDQIMRLPKYINVLLFKLDEKGIISLEESNFIMCLIGERKNELTYEQLAERLGDSTKEFTHKLNLLLEKGFLKKVGVISYDFSPFSYILFNYDKEKDKNDKTYLINLVENAINLSK